MKLRSGRYISLKISRPNINETEDEDSFCLYTLFKNSEKKFCKQRYYEYSVKRTHKRDMEARILVLMEFYKNTVFIDQEMGK